MRPSQTLRSTLKHIDRKDYGAYQSLKGDYEYTDFQLFISQIPKDPYAPPHTGIYRIRLPHAYLGIAVQQFKSNIAGIAFRDFLARLF